MTDGPKHESEESMENREAEANSSSEDSELEAMEEPIEEVKICDAEEKFERIIQHLEVIEENFANKCNDIKDKVKNIESDSDKKLKDAFKSVNATKERQIDRNIKLQDMLDIMNKRVCDARQIVGASNMAKGKAPSKVGLCEPILAITLYL